MKRQTIERRSLANGVPVRSIGPRGSAGFTYLGVLFLVAVLGVALASIGIVWSTQVRREKEAELLFIGQEFQRALRAWNRANGNVGDGFPKSLELLLSDPNAPVNRRFLRRIYVDPMTGKAEWGLVRTPTGTIRGVYSLSTEKPIRTQLPEALGEQATATSYADWKFMVGPDLKVSAAATDIRTPPPGTLPPGLDPGAEPIPVPPPPVDPKTRRCSQIAQVDNGACLALEARYGPRASVPCFTSARARDEACRNDAPIPPLVTNVR